MQPLRSGKRFGQPERRFARQKLPHCTESDCAAVHAFEFLLTVSVVVGLFSGESL